MRAGLLVLAAVAVLGNAYVFECLDKCECDTKDQIAHCHNGGRKELVLPTDDKLKGFHAIGLTFNDLEKLPKESAILEVFPDLLAIDVERNPRFECASILDFNKIKIISDCYKNVTDLDAIPPLLRPTPECDLQCQAKKHYKDLHAYVLKLWEIIKEKYQNFDKDAALAQIKAFFIDSIQSLNRHIDRGLEEFHPRNQKVTADPTLATAAPTDAVELD